MHPPLDRPHPLCQEQIDALRECHANTSKLKFWACNELKFALDTCFKQEKQVLLREMNSDFEEKRKREDDALQEAIGHKQSFQDYLKTDKQYLKEMEKAKQEQSKGSYTDKAFS